MTEIAPSMPVLDQATGRPAPSQAAIRREASQEQAMKIVNRYMWLSGGIGLIPAPFFDQVAIGGLLAKMLNDIGRLYGVKFTDQKLKVTVAAFLGGAHTNWITYAPVINTIGTIFTRPAISAAIVYGIGKLFVHHFETGAWT